MNGDWDPESRAPEVAYSVFAILRAVTRGIGAILLLGGGLIFLLLTRLVERPIWGLHRPLTPHITRAVCRGILRLIGVKTQVSGEIMPHHGALVANHATWLDIFALNAQSPVYFVSKSEVAGWVGIGWLARATGTVFIRRDARDAFLQKQVFEDRLRAGHRLLFFPEGTSTDGQRVLTFKPTLFQAFFTPDIKEDLWIQPVSVAYTAPVGQDPRFYGWWGDMLFAPHLLKVLAFGAGGSVSVKFHAPHKITGFEGRKPLAKRCEQIVRTGMPVSAERLDQ